MNFGYARVSTVGQSLDTQLEQLSFCDRIFQEKISGASMGRPELDRLISIMRSGDTLTVTKLDRLARSTKDLLEIVEDLNKRNSALKILNINLDTSTPTGKLMLTMLGAIATFEREMMLERQSEGISRAKAEGKYKGRKGLSTERQGLVLTMRKNGATVAETASSHGISKDTVMRICKAARLAA